MALKLDKDSLLEFLGKNKDQLFLALLVVTAAYGGYYLYSTSSMSIDQIIQNWVEEGKSRGPGTTIDEDATAAEVADRLTAKQTAETFELKNNPFGSPEDQLRIRQQVEAYYKQGIDYYEAQRFQESIAMFDRVIELDVTETRIRYPILPSEYKRRSQSLDAQLNFDRILTTAKTEESEGDRLASESRQTEALNAYVRSSKLVSDVLDSSPDLPQEKLDQLKQVQTSVDQKMRGIQKNLIQQEVNKSTQEAQSVLGGNDLVAHIQSSFRVGQLLVQINQVDPNAQMIDQGIRTRLETLMQSLQTKLKNNFQEIIIQAENQFNTAVQSKDPQKAQQAIFALTQALNFVNQGDDQGMRQQIIAKRNNFIAMRAQLVIEKAQAFLQAQTQFLSQGDYSQFDQNGKYRYLADLNQLLETGGNAIASDIQQTIQNMQRQINALKLPPAVTEDYSIISIKPVSPTSSSYSVEYVDRNSRSSKPTKTTWREGVEDRRTKITMKVDKDRGVVILSKSGYTDAETPLSSTGQ